MIAAAAIDYPGVVSRSHKTASAREVVLADETLRTVFLLGHASSSDPATLTDDRASRFLLWFALEGRLKYHHVVFSPQYLAFLSTPMPPFATRLAAYLLMRKSDLRERFARDLDQFHAWYYAEGARQHGLAPFITARERIAQGTRSGDELRPAADRTGTPGVNVVGFGSNVMGIGEDVRALVAALGHAGIPRALVSLTLSSSIGTVAAYDSDTLQIDAPIFPINIYALPPFETARLRVEQGAQLFHRRYAIGYWPWELTCLPEQWRSIFDTVDEIWAPSEFLLKVFRQYTRKPVVYMPPYLNLAGAPTFDAARYGIAPDDLIFLNMFDFNSFIARKNPLGAIEAFQAAFPNFGVERLVIKTLNVHSNPDARQMIEAAVAGDHRITFIHDSLTRPQLTGLIARADCLISLHRAEGFGRVIAEAMALGTVVVATDWSGSTSFLDASRGYPVAFTLRDIEKGEYVFDHGSQWAEPSIDDAVAKLRQVRTHTDDNATMRLRASAFVRSAYGIDTVATALASRLDAIQAEHPQLAP